MEHEFQGTQQIGEKKALAREGLLLQRKPRERDEVVKLMEDAGIEFRDGAENDVFRFVASTEAQDRYGDVIKLDGWDLKQFKRNPVVPWCHDYSKPPVGVALDAWIDPEFKVKGSKRTGALLFDMIHADGDPFAESLRVLTAAGVLRATSVGFLPTDYRFLCASEDGKGPDDEEMAELGMSSSGYVFYKSELIEISQCTIGANPDALGAAMRTKGFDPAQAPCIFGISDEAFEGMLSKEGPQPVMGWQAARRALTPLEAVFYSVAYADKIKAPLDAVNLSAKARLLSMGLNVGCSAGEIGELAEDLGLCEAPVCEPVRLSVASHTVESGNLGKSKEEEEKPAVSAGQVVEAVLCAIPNAMKQRVGAVLSKKNRQRIESAAESILTGARTIQDVLDDASKEDDENSKSEISPEEAPSEPKSLVGDSPRPSPEKGRATVQPANMADVLRLALSGQA